MDKASVPEPPPKNEGVPVTEALIKWIERKDLNELAKVMTIELIKSRDEFGFNKYGQHLMTKDGRDSTIDALQEFGDLLQYIYKAKLNGENLNRLREMMPILISLIYS